MRARIVAGGTGEHPSRAGGGRIAASGDCFPPQATQVVEERFQNQPHRGVGIDVGLGGETPFEQFPHAVQRIGVAHAKAIRQARGREGTSSGDRTESLTVPFRRESNHPLGDNALCGGFPGLLLDLLPDPTREVDRVVLRDSNPVRTVSRSARNAGSSNIRAVSRFPSASAAAAAIATPSASGSSARNTRATSSGESAPNLRI